MQPLPPTTQALMLICTGVFCLQFLLPGSLLDWFALQSPWSGRLMPWQAVSYAFLHADFGHLFFNMLGLWMFGAEFELLWGRRRYLMYLLACVVVAAALQLGIGALMGYGGPTIGASGAVFGLMLALLMYFPHRMITLVIPPVTISVKVFVTIAVLLTLFFGVRGDAGVAHFAHLGGMLGGLLMIRYWRGQVPFGRKRRF